MKLTGGSFSRAGALTALALLSVLGASLAVVSPASAAEGCEAGPPVSYDFNGDGNPDLAAFNGDTAGFGSPVEVQSVDLNGDVCADLLDHSGTKLTWMLGSPTGLALDTAQGADAYQGGGAAVFDDVVAMRQGNVTRIIASTDCADIDGCRSPFLDVITLDADAMPDERNRISLEEKVSKSTEQFIPLAADDGVVVVGNPHGEKVQVFVAGDDPSGLVYSTQLDQETPGVPGASTGSGTGDSFGSSVALREGYLAVGVPGEKVGSVAAAGRVQLFRWDTASKSFTPGRSIHQGTTGVPGANEKADHFGASLAIGAGLTAANSYDVIVGAPDENVGSVVNAGSVTVLNHSKAIYRTYTQSTKYVPGAVKKNGWFGHDVRSIGSESGAESLAATYVGARAADGTASSFNLVYTNPGKLTSTTKWHTLIGT